MGYRKKLQSFSILQSKFTFKKIWRVVLFIYINIINHLNYLNSFTYVYTHHFHTKLSIYKISALTILM